MLLKEKKLYRIEFIKPCRIYESNSLMRFRNSSILDINNLKPDQYGIIPKGVKGWVLKKWGKLYFSPDDYQEDLEFFTPSEQPHILISLKKEKTIIKR